MEEKTVMLLLSFEENVTCKDCVLSTWKPDIEQVVCTGLKLRGACPIAGRRADCPLLETQECLFHCKR